MRLKFISAQPAIDYYAWQIEVYLENFLGLGYKGDDIPCGRVLHGRDTRVMD